MESEKTIKAYYSAIRNHINENFMYFAVALVPALPFFIVYELSDIFLPLFDLHTAGIKLLTQLFWFFGWAILLTSWTRGALKGAHRENIEVFSMGTVMLALVLFFIFLLLMHLRGFVNGLVPSNVEMAFFYNLALSYGVYILLVFIIVRASFSIISLTDTKKIGMWDSFKETHKQEANMILSGLAAALPYLGLKIILHNILAGIEPYISDEETKDIISTIIYLPISVFIIPFYTMIIATGFIIIYKEKCLNNDAERKTS